ncbi:MAG: sulfite exporter TauE/SafE family protein, partial [Methanobacteriaceae archaeon]|nr:sulfite exporter TauE/SafE family protein [Methanobacteriaceae archaeon]
AIPCVICAIIFSSLGAKVQVGIPENYLRIFMLIALPITLIFMLRKKSLSDNSDKDFKFDKKSMLKAICISCLLGFYDGVYGPGTGTFLLLFFVNIVKMRLKEANGMSKAINWSTNAGALMYFFYSGKVIVPLAIMAGICNMVGAYLGSNLFAKKGVNIARPIMIIVMSIFIIKVIFELCMQ